MRHLRVLATAAVLAAVISQPSAAQEGRQFKDAWFWGARAGGLVYSSNLTDNTMAPMAGIDWFITRSVGGLYVGLDQTFLTTRSYFTTPGASGFSDPVLSVHNLRRLSVAGMVFPMQSPKVHPYFGLGAAIHKVGSTQYETAFASSAQFSIAEDSVQSKKAAVAPMAIAGVQVRLSRFSVFGQAIGTFPPPNFFLSADPSKRGLSYSVEGGIRYNVGTSIEKVH